MGLDGPLQTGRILVARSLRCTFVRSTVLGDSGQNIRRDSSVVCTLISIEPGRSGRVGGRLVVGH